MAWSPPSLAACSFSAATSKFQADTPCDGHKFVQCLITEALEAGRSVEKDQDVGHPLMHKRAAESALGRSFLCGWCTSTAASHRYLSVIGQKLCRGLVGERSP